MKMNKSDMQDFLAVIVMAIYAAVVFLGVIPDERYKDAYTLVTMVLAYYFTKYKPGDNITINTKDTEEIK